MPGAPDMPIGSPRFIVEIYMPTGETLRFSTTHLVLPKAVPLTPDSPGIGWGGGGAGVGGAGS